MGGFKVRGDEEAFPIYNFFNDLFVWSVPFPLPLGPSTKYLLSFCFIQVNFHFKVQIISLKSAGDPCYSILI